jgi:flagellar assembly protein FliH
MNSKYKTVRVGPGRRLNDAVSELMAKSARDVSRLGFSLVDEPDATAPDDYDPGAAQQAAAEQTRLRLEVARAEGMAEAKRSFEVNLAAIRVEERARVDLLRTEFGRDRQRYFASAESQVVLLALAIARKVLGREADADAMHLRSIVKAALARVQDGSSTILRVPEEEAVAWAEIFEIGTSEKVQVLGDDRMAPGECSLQTNVGTVDLGVEIQMEEIERGFRELMHEQGGSGSDAS